MIRHTTMPKTKVALTIDSALLERVDDLVARERFRNRSQAIETAVAKKLARLSRTGLAEECAKLIESKNVASPMRPGEPTAHGPNTERGGPLGRPESDPRS